MNKKIQDQGPWEGEGALREAHEGIKLLGGHREVEGRGNGGDGRG